VAAACPRGANCGYADRGMGWARPILPTVRRRRGGAERAPHPPGTPAVAIIATRPASRVLVDANTRTFWSRGAEGPVTLVESDAPVATHPLRERVRAMVAAHDRGARRGGSRPPGNPAFSEALFVELVRGGQHARAFDLLAPDCQLHWGSAERFAAAHRGSSLERLEGVNVVAVRHLDEWVDPHRGDRHSQVAELDVEYSFDAGRRRVKLSRTVHLVAVEGRWRSLSYPVEAAIAS
jgi:hypothetical protein